MKHVQCGLRGATASLAALSLALLLALFASLALPGQAHATALTSSSGKYKVTQVSAKEKKAYKRAVAACMDYANQPNPIVVDLSDLNLTRTQAKNVWSMIHANGELFWINCYGDTYTSKQFTLPCYYSDAKITKMRKKLDAAVAKAMKRIGPSMSPAAKVHMLHDYVIDRVDYQDKCKTAYEGLVRGRGDCFGFTLSMDVLLRRCGFEVDVAFNSKLDHSWNLVKVSGKWYHVDATWDNGYTGANYLSNFNWSKRRCHLYLLQSDASMLRKTTDPSTGVYISKNHAGWTCHHKCTSTKYDFTRDLSKGFYKHCGDYKSIVRSFTAAGLKYRVVGAGKVKLAGVASAKARAASSVTVPASVKHKGAKYKVVGLAAGALGSAKARVLNVASPFFSKVSVSNSLVGSSVKRLKLSGSATKKKTAYKQYFAEQNGGKAVSVA